MTTSVPPIEPDPTPGDAQSRRGARALVRTTNRDGNDSDALIDALFLEYHARLCDFVYVSIRSRDAAEDIVQDIFLRLWEQRDACDLRNPAAYLYHAARNGVISYRRRRRVRTAWVERAQADDDAAQDPTGESIELNELTRAVRAAVAALPERCRLCFTLSRDHGLSYADIGRALGISVRTVEVHIARAIKAIRVHIAPYLVVMIVLQRAIAHVASAWTALMR
jgi:RNA polymerase sigma-70 factor (ECF subfamily)